jgi:hypothetical protein
VSARLSLLVLACAVLLAVCFACSREPGFATRFPHEKHLASATECGGVGEPPCLNCGTCHAGVQADRSASRPSISVCSSCHRDTEGLDRFVARPAVLEPGPRTILFSHDQHLKLSQVSGQCIQCHAGAVSPKPGPPLFPPMEACLNCHEHRAQFSRGICTNCHAPEDLKRLRPETFARHDHDFVRHHANMSRRNGALCETCHAQSDCTDCHDMFQNLTLVERRPEAIERALVHRADFMTRHAIESMASPATCARCHSAPSCDECHVARGVSGNAVGALNPHPPEWIGQNTRSARFHGSQARRNLFQCASCHEQGPATNCIRCHAPGGPGGNPHPRGWKSSQSRSDTMCRYCHGA